MLKVPSIQNLHFGVYGLGRTGKATLDFFQYNQASYEAYDDNTSTRTHFASEGYNIVECVDWKWDKMHALVLSPGIPHHHPSPHSVALLAQKHGVPIITDIDLLMRANLDAVLIGVTGTNGKSTTSALLGYIFAQAGERSIVAGNIGVSPLSFSWDATPLYGVLELSSYQLERMRQNRLNAAIFLNLTPDHVDRHPTPEEYMLAKSKIFNSSDLKVAVLGVDETPMQKLYKEIQNTVSTLIPVSVKYTPEKGIYIEDGYLVDQYWGDGKILKLSECMHLKGDHNAQNMAACYALARYFGIEKDAIIEALKSFKSLPHRCEWVATIDHVELINDSKATNVDSTCKALSSYDKIYWIVGGQYKQDPLEPLDAFLPKIKKIYTIGSSESVFLEHFKSKVEIESCKTLDQAFEFSLRDARTSEEPSVVLLSPACASFDQFRHFEHRGDSFKELCSRTFEALETRKRARTIG